MVKEDIIGRRKQEKRRERKRRVQEKRKKEKGGSDGSDLLSKPCSEPFFIKHDDSTECSTRYQSHSIIYVVLPCVLEEKRCVVGVQLTSMCETCWVEHQYDFLDVESELPHINEALESIPNGGIKKANTFITIHRFISVDMGYLRSGAYFEQYASIYVHGP
ncbi:hypothetical protein JTB14_034340 [Gonioctena quinquepunctata]|nr:hypothetical protein JTB14_034340 [Gonioctena quinquepunctata]